MELSVPNCKECATYFPGRELSSVRHIHHWREGNLLSNSKCAVCKKTCWSSECLAGYRYENGTKVLVLLENIDIIEIFEIFYICTFVDIFFEGVNGAAWQPMLLVTSP